MAIRLAVIKDNCQLAAKALLLKSLVPGKGTGNTILATEFYGKIG
jgi:hypothetical protein